MTREELAPILAYLSAAVNREIPRPQAEVYFGQLHDLPAWAVRGAAKEAVRRSEYPTVVPVGTLRRLAEEALAETPAQNSARIARERALAAALAQVNHDEVKRILDRHLGRNGDGAP